MVIKPRGDSFQVTGTLNGQRIRKQFKTEDEAALYVSSVSVRPNAVTNGSFKHIFELTVNSRESWKEENSKPRMNAKLILDAGDLWGKHVDKVTLDELIVLFDKFKKAGNKGSTLNRKKSALAVLYSVARELNYTSKTFSFLKQSTRAESGRERVFSSSEIKKLMDGCDSLGFDLMREMITVLLYGGMRVGELYDIYHKHRDSLNKKTKRLKIHTLKGGVDRTILLNDVAYAALVNILSRNEIYSRRLFNSRWETLREHVGMNHDAQFVPHSLRHTCASKLVSLGVQLVKIKEYMGHKNIQTTMKYAHVDEAGLDECSQALVF